MKKFLIAGNWKMNTTPQEGLVVLKEMTNTFQNANLNKSVEILICPPFLHISGFKDETKDSKIQIGAQNCFYEEKGAFTGEISPSMLSAIKCEYVIIGHSERRQYFNETNTIINKKIQTALKNSLKVILCIGESLEQRNNNTLFEIIEHQIKSGLNGIIKSDLLNISIAYEPIWAIGTGLTANLEQISEMHNFIINTIANLYKINRIQVPKILYGGSLNEKNAQEILSKDGVNGGLIGGASLNSSSFCEIISIANSISINE